MQTVLMRPHALRPEVSFATPLQRQLRSWFHVFSWCGCSAAA